MKRAPPLKIHRPKKPLPRPPQKTVVPEKKVPAKKMVPTPKPLPKTVVVPAKKMVPTTKPLPKTVTPAKTMPTNLWPVISISPAQSSGAFAWHIQGSVARRISN